MKKDTKTSKAVKILHRRYIGKDAKRQASLEAERVKSDVARKIYDLRKEAGLTQKELAELVGTTQSVISRLEDADYEGHTLSMLSRIATALQQRLTVVIDPFAHLGQFAREKSFGLTRPYPKFRVDTSDLHQRRGLKPGEIAPCSGQYQQIGPRGGLGKKVTVTKGEPMPPTPRNNMTYRIIDSKKK